MSDYTVKSVFEGGRTTSYVAGRIDSSNAKALGKDLRSAYEAHPDAPISLDFKEVEYISSAGLRALLELRKLAAPGAHATKIAIREAAPHVAEILEDTGFSRMFDVHETLKEFDVEGLDVLAKTMKGFTYRVDEDTVLAVYMQDYPLSLVERERENTQNALVAGAPVLISFGTVHVGASYGILYEAPNATTVAEAVSSGEGTPQEWGAKVGELLKSLHATTAEEGQFSDKRAQGLACLEDVVARGLFTDEEVRPAVELYEALPEASSILHGNCTPHTILVRDGDLLLMDMVDAGFGHPAIDLAGAYACYVMSHELRKEAAMQLYGIDADTLVAMWGALMRSYFGTDDEEELARHERIIDAFARVRMVLMLSWFKSAPQQFVDGVRGMLEAHAEVIKDATALLGEAASE